MDDMTNAMKTDINKFVRKHQDSLRQYLRLLGCADDILDDLAQETFLVFLRKDPSLPSDGAAAAFLRRTAINLLRNSRRIDARRMAILRQDAADRIWSRYQLDARPSAYGDTLRACLKELPQSMNDTVNLHYRDGMSGPQVAAAKGLSEADVWTTLSRARRKLRNCINRKLNHEL